MNKLYVIYHILLVQGAVRTMISGGVGGMSLWIVIFPFDVIKSRMQIHRTNLSMLPLLLKISRDEGMLYCYIEFLSYNRLSTRPKIPEI